MLCSIWYQLFNLKDVKKTHEGVLLFARLQAESWNICNFTKSNTSPRVLFTFLKIVQMVPNRVTYRIHIYHEKESFQLKLAKLKIWWSYNEICSKVILLRGNYTTDFTNYVLKHPGIRISV